jgi:hypothetical protein
MPRASIKDEEMYEALRKDGASQEKAARISNAAAATSRKKIGKRGGHADAYEEWTRDDLRRKAADIGIQGRSKMTKSQLIKALRTH